MIAAGYWLLDSSVHWLFYAHETHFELIPSEFNELWMRGAIVGMMLALGAYADYHNRRLREAEAERVRLFKTTVSATHHVMNNFLNQMQLFQLEAEQSRDFDPSLLPQFEQIIQETATQIRQLQALEEVNAARIQAIAYAQTTQPGPEQVPPT